MKNLFQQETVDELLARLDKLQPASPRQWGKMDAAQMMAHCSAGLDMASGRLNPPRMFIGRLIGPFVKPIYTNDKPFSKNNPTDKTLLVADQREFSRNRRNSNRKSGNFKTAEKRNVHGIRIHFLDYSPRRIGAAACTNIWTITCSNSAREGAYPTSTAPPFTLKISPVINPA